MATREPCGCRAQPIDLGQLTREVAASLGILAEERRQRPAVRCRGRRVSVSADRLVLREAITNVVDNAIKYSPHGVDDRDSGAARRGTARG